MSDFDPRATEPVPSSTSNPPYTGQRPLRMVREAAFTPLDVAAYVVAFVMVCGPLALGAFHL